MNQLAQVASIQYDGLDIVALGVGKHIYLLLESNFSVLQSLVTHDSIITCLAWCDNSSRLASSSSNSIAIHSPRKNWTPNGSYTTAWVLHNCIQLPHSRLVTSLSWPQHFADSLLSSGSELTIWQPSKKNKVNCNAPFQEEADWAPVWTTPTEPVSFHAAFALTDRMFASLHLNQNHVSVWISSSPESSSDLGGSDSIVLQFGSLLCTYFYFCVFLFVCLFVPWKQQLRIH
jgi:WD40 repeat protein